MRTPHSVFYRHRATNLQITSRLLFTPKNKAHLSANRPTVTKITNTEEHCTQTSYIQFYRNQITKVANTNK